MITTHKALHQTSDQVKGIPISATLKINEEIIAKRAAGEAVCHMGFGESPFPVHPYIVDALIKAAKYNQYPPTMGLLALREKAQAYFGKRFGFDERSMDTIVSPGSKDIIFAAQLAIKGDLILPTPSWVSYAPQAKLAGSKAIQIRTKAENYHKLTGRMISETLAEARANGLNPTKIILNYPNNPTGLGFDEQELIDLAETLRGEGIIAISDEIYGLVNHKGEHKSIAAYYPEGTIVTTGLSKHLSLGGYRIGFGFIPKLLEGLTADMAAVASETWSCVSNPIQRASIAALEENPDVEQHIATSTKVHNLASNYVRGKLIDMGLNYPPLAGGFYLYPNFTPFAKELEKAYGVKTSDDLARDLLNRSGLAALPGSDFGDDPAVLALRLAITDYDGGEAMAYLNTNPNATADELVKTACPRVYDACKIMQQYFSF
ncbi:MAG: aminotransferase class I/II-fold pyridoxal phosphate-dependent enzyme [Sphingomonadales bacterium]|nr:aminotransferase class I/II-fold pyridoxal phosphate-dependent enzyme [Sphingomonadales bacterium]